MFASHLNTSPIHTCHSINLNPSNKTSELIKTKFDRVCYLVRFFDTAHFNPLNFGAMNHQALVNELVELLEEFESLKDCANLSETELLIAKNTCITIAIFVKNFSEMQDSLQHLNEMRLDPQNYEVEDQQEFIQYLMECVTTQFQSCKYATFFTLQLTQSLFLLELSSLETQQIERQFQKLIQNLAQNNYYFFELQDVSIQNIENQQILKDYFLTLSIDLELLTQLSNSLQLHMSNSYDLEAMSNCSDLLNLASAYKFFQESASLLIDPDYLEDKLIVALSAYHHFLKQIKVPN